MKKPKQRWTGKWTSSKERDIRRSSSSSSSQEEHIEERRSSEDSNSDQDNYNLSYSKIKEEDEDKEEEVDIEGCPTPPHPTLQFLPMQHPLPFLPIYPRLPYHQPNINNPIFQLPLHPLHPLISPLFMVPTRPTLHKPHPLRPTPTTPFNRVPSPAPDRLQTPDSTLRSPRPRNGKKKLSKDTKIAIKLGLSQAEIKKATTYPMDQFQDFCNEKQFGEEQISILKDIRKRCKNKIAAQNCRKRKIDKIEELRDTLDSRESETLKQKKRKEMLEDEKKYIAAKMKMTKEAILRKMGKNPSMFKVEVNEATSQVDIIKREH